MRNMKETKFVMFERGREFWPILIIPSLLSDVES